jgi:hypothetical protein
MSVASPAPSSEDGNLHISQRLPAIHADLGPAARAAFGRWVAAVYGLVAHLEVCCFGCTAEMTRCFEGDAAVDDERSCWQAWRAARGETAQ